MDNEIVTAHRLTIYNQKTIKKFLTLDKAEVSIKAIEVLQDYEQSEMMYVRFRTTREMFMHELKQNIGSK